MAYDFPENPTNGQRYPTDAASTGKVQYQWNSSQGVWNIVPTFVALNDQAAYNSYEWPLADGSGDQMLKTDGDGQLYWSTETNPTLTVLQLNVAFNGVETDYTLKDSQNNTFTPVPSTNIMVFLGGVPQIPGDAFTVSGSTISFSEAPPIGTTFYAVSTVSI